MNANELVSALRHLEIRTPYGLDPGSVPGGRNTPITEAEWNNYQWNPPQYMIDQHPDIDPDASVKPTWQQITDAVAPARLAQDLPQMIKLANSEATRRIAVNYHPQAGIDRNKEWEVRFFGVDLTAQNAERIRLIAVCHALEVRINAAQTIVELDAIDIESDSVWSADDD